MPLAITKNIWSEYQKNIRKKYKYHKEKIKEIRKKFPG